MSLPEDSTRIAPPIPDTEAPCTEESINSNDPTDVIANDRFVEVLLIFVCCDPFPWIFTADAIVRVPLIWYSFASKTITDRPGKALASMMAARSDIASGVEVVTFPSPGSRSGKSLVVLTTKIFASAAPASMAIGPVPFPSRKRRSPLAEVNVITPSLAKWLKGLVPFTPRVT